MASIIEQDRRAEQGAWLFLISLGIFFLSSMILFVVYIALRLKAPEPEVKAYHLPIGFIFSTTLLIGVSVSLHWAVMAARLDRTRQVLQLVIASALFAGLFFVIQSYGMYDLLSRALKMDQPIKSPFVFTFFLALVHALHVVGGVISMVRVVRKSIRHEYDHERYWGLKFCALYWHFLDGVWVFMLVSFAVAAYLIQRA